MLLFYYLDDNDPYLNYSVFNKGYDKDYIEYILEGETGIILSIKYVSKLVIFKINFSFLIFLF